VPQGGSHCASSGTRTQHGAECAEKKIKRKSHPTRAWDKGKGKAEIERVPQSAFFAILQDALLFAPHFIRNRTGLGGTFVEKSNSMVC